MEELKDEQLPQASIAAFFEERVKDCELVVSLDDMVAISKDIASEVVDYRHSYYQAAIAGVILSNAAAVTVAVAPTGSGKTWIQGLVAKYYCRLGKKVVVVEPSEMLAQQAANKLALVDFDITITSMRRLFEEGPWHEVVILDEYDAILER
jgi:reverse gyrase